MKRGTGWAMVNRKPMGAHRIAWQLKHGEICGGLWVLHKCDTPPCVRPDHLFLGDAHDNSLDMTSKARQRQGEDVPNSRLRADQVVEIRQLAAAGAKQRDIAGRFGITQPNVGYICRRETWRHIE